MQVYVFGSIRGRTNKDKKSDTNKDKKSDTNKDKKSDTNKDRKWKIPGGKCTYSGVFEGALSAVLRSALEFSI